MAILVCWRWGLYAVPYQEGEVNSCSFINEDINNADIDYTNQNSTADQVYQLIEDAVN
jgi:hypothetical protein